MKTYVALFRGINVGGKNVLPMKELAAMLEDIGARNVETYIQSGNAVFQIEETNTPTLSNEIANTVKSSCGFEPQVLVLGVEDLRKSIEANPFTDAGSEPKTLHLFFLASVPKDPDLEALDSLKSGRERFALEDGVFYLHAPDGIGRSRLAASAEKLLGVPATGRNWRTVRKVMAMAERSDEAHVT